MAEKNNANRGSVYCKCRYATQSDVLGIGVPVHWKDENLLRQK